MEDLTHWDFSDPALLSGLIWYAVREYLRLIETASMPELQYSTPGHNSYQMRWSQLFINFAHIGSTKCYRMRH